jgi:hypothetical protein
MHEIRHDGYRMIARREIGRQRLLRDSMNICTMRPPRVFYHACLNGTGRHRVEATRLALPIRSVAALAQEQEPSERSSPARG